MNTLEAQVIESRQQSIKHRENLEAANKRLRAEQALVRQLQADNDEAFDAVRSFKDEFVTEQQRLRSSPSRSLSPPPRSSPSALSAPSRQETFHSVHTHFTAFTDVQEDDNIS